MKNNNFNGTPVFESVNEILRLSDAYTNDVVGKVEDVVSTSDLDTYLEIWYEMTDSLEAIIAEIKSGKEIKLSECLGSFATLQALTEMTLQDMTYALSILNNLKKVKINEDMTADPMQQILDDILKLY